MELMKSKVEDLQKNNVGLIKKNGDLEELVFQMRNKMTIISTHSKHSSKHSINLNS